MTVPMRPIVGPDCPNCGCRDSELLSQGERWGQWAETRQCNHCGRRFTATTDVEPPSDASANGEARVCPECGSTSTVVRSTRRQVRHCMCRDCGRRFKAPRG
jgi:uncharacterized Zn finger protein